MKIFHIHLKKTISFITAFLMVSVMCIHFPMKSVGSDANDINFQELADQIGYLVNEARKEAGLNPVYMLPYLNDIATARSKECLTKFSHERQIVDANGNVILYDSEGKPLKVKHMLADNFPWYKVYENIANTMSTAEATFNQWKNSPKHWANIMNPNVRYLGVGVVYEPNSIYESSEQYPEGYAKQHWYWTQVFIETYSHDEAVAYYGWNKFDEDGNVELEGGYYPEMYQVEPKCCGDVNGDGIVDCFDLVMLRKYILKEITLNPLQEDACDVCFDGYVTMFDCVYLKQYILGKIPSIPYMPW